MLFRNNLVHSLLDLACRFSGNALQNENGHYWNINFFRHSVSFAFHFFAVHCNSLAMKQWQSTSAFDYVGGDRDAELGGDVKTMLPWIPTHALSAVSELGIQHLTDGPSVRPWWDWGTARDTSGENTAHIVWSAPRPQYELPSRRENKDEWTGRMRKWNRSEKCIFISTPSCSQWRKREPGGGTRLETDVGADCLNIFHGLECTWSLLTNGSLTTKWNNFLSCWVSWKKRTNGIQPNIQMGGGVYQKGLVLDWNQSAIYLIQPNWVQIFA